jgi:hypothetical protein
MKAVGTVLGPDQKGPSGDTAHAEQCIGEQFMSIKQLLNRASAIRSSSLLLSNVNTGYNVWPWFVSMPRLLSTGMAQMPPGGDLYSYLAPMYANYRGGMNITAIPNATVANYSGTTMAALLSTANFASGTQVFTACNLSSQTESTGGYLTPSTTVAPTGYAFTIPTNQQWSHTVPYMASTRFSMVNPDYDGRQVVWDTTDAPTPRLDVQGTFNASNLNFYRHVRDDFQLGYFISAPPLYVSST